MKKLNKIAIIGFGSIGRKHLRILKEIRPEIDVTLVRLKNTRSWNEESLSNRIFKNIDDVVEFGVDAAIIASPAPFHIKHSIPFVEKKIPVLIEKPISTELNDAVKLLKLSNKNKSIILVGYVLRHSKQLSIFEEELSKKIIGQVLFAKIEYGSFLPKWRPAQDYRNTVSARSELGGGVLFELSHEIDYANCFFGPFKTIQSIQRNTNSLEINTEDIVDMILTNYQEESISIHLDFCTRISRRTCSVFGSKSSLHLDLIKNSIKYLGENRETCLLGSSRLGPDMYRNQLIHFIDCIERNVKPLVTLEDSIEVLKLINGARQSNMEKIVVDL